METVLIVVGIVVLVLVIELWPTPFDRRLRQRERAQRKADR